MKSPLEFIKARFFFLMVGAAQAMNLVCKYGSHLHLPDQIARYNRDAQLNLNLRVNNQSFLVYVCPMQYLGHSYAKIVCVVCLKLKINWMS